VVVGGSGAIYELENALVAHARDQSGQLPERLPNSSILNDWRPEAAGESVARALNLMDADRLSVVTACSSGSAAIALSYERILSGQWELAIAGGADCLSRLCYGGFNALHAMDPEPCKPFDRHRRGMNLGEGGGFVVLEQLEHAQERDAKILAEMLGYGLTSDAYHLITPDPSGEAWARVINHALSDAGIDASGVDYVNAHGTATPSNDAAETAAFKLAFGDRAAQIPVSTVKSMIGHCQFAAGAIEAVVTVQSIRHGVIPPTVNLRDPDPVCDLDYVPNVARRTRVNKAISCSFGIGGSSTALLLGRWQP